MQKHETRFFQDLTSFDQTDSSSARGLTDWSVPWADLMMVMFVLFVVLFIYASTHKDVKILFSSQSSDKARASSTLDPLLGLIGQIASRNEMSASGNVVRMSEREVLYRSRANGISVVREGPGQVRISLRGELFFDHGQGTLRPGSSSYLDEIAKVVKLNLGRVHVIGFADSSEATGTESFTLSSERASNVAAYMIKSLGVAPERLVVTGRGAYQPELPGTSPTNRIMNRRVEIFIVNHS